MLNPCSWVYPTKAGVSWTILNVVVLLVVAIVVLFVCFLLFCCWCLSLCNMLCFFFPSRFEYRQIQYYDNKHGGGILVLVKKQIETSEGISEASSSSSSVLYCRGSSKRGMEAPPPLRERLCLHLSRSIRRKELAKLHKLL